MDYIDLVENYAKNKELLKRVIQLLQQADKTYEDPSILRASLNITKQQYKEIMK